MSNVVHLPPKHRQSSSEQDYWIVHVPLVIFRMKVRKRVLELYNKIKSQETESDE